MKRILLTLIAVVFLLPVGLQAQEPIPGPIDPVPEVDIDVTQYPVGASEDDRAFVDAVLKAAKDEGLGRFRMWKLKRRLKNPRFVAEAQAEILETWYWEDPDAVQGLIDWENLDTEKLREVFDMVMQLIKFISDLFGMNSPYLEPLLRVAVILNAELEARA